MIATESQGLRPQIQVAASPPIDDVDVVTIVKWRLAGEMANIQSNALRYRVMDRRMT